MPRRVEREWLDDLPPDDPRAVRCRRDLRIINRMMGNARIIGDALAAHLRSKHPRVAELGAGDGTLVLRIARKDSDWNGAQLTFVDQQPVVGEETVAEFARRGCTVTLERADVFDWLGGNGSHYDAIVANLFLHHFEAPQLAELFELAARRTGLFIASEPARAWLPLAGSHLVGLLGCNDVTRHDAVLSVRAGFAGDELSQLWPQGWELEEGRANAFSHRFVAVKA